MCPRGMSNTVIIGGFDVLLRAPFDVDSLGANVVIAAVANRRIRVLGGMCITSGACNVRWRSGVAGRLLTGWLPLTAAGNGFVWEVKFIGYHWIETDPGEPLVMELSAGDQTGGMLVYDVE